MAQSKPTLQLILSVAGLLAFDVALATDKRESTAPSNQSYLVDVAVVSVQPIEVTRSVARPEKTCELVRRSNDYSRNDRRYSGYDSDSRYDRRGYDRRDRNERGGVGAQILGGLIGGAIGNQFGGGNGKKALTIAGALIGSSIARGDGHRDGDRRYAGQREIEPEYRCKTITRTREVTDVTGYDVTYRYNDTLYNRRMDYDPGDTLELRVRAVPEFEQTRASSPAPSVAPILAKTVADS